MTIGCLILNFGLILNLKFIEKFDTSFYKKKVSENLKKCQVSKKFLVLVLVRDTSLIYRHFLVFFLQFCCLC